MKNLRGLDYPLLTGLKNDCKTSWCSSTFVKGYYRMKDLFYLLVGLGVLFAPFAVNPDLLSQTPPGGSQCPPYNQLRTQACSVPATLKHCIDGGTCTNNNEQARQDGDFGFQKQKNERLRTQVLRGSASQTATCYFQYSCYMDSQMGCTWDENSKVPIPEVKLVVEDC